MSTAEKAKKLRAVRGGHRGAATKTLQKTTTILSSPLPSDEESLSELIANLKLYQSSVEAKIHVLTKLDDELLDCLDDAADLTDAVMDADAFAESVREELIRIGAFIRKAEEKVAISTSPSTVSQPSAALQPPAGPQTHGLDPGLASQSTAAQSSPPQVDSADHPSPPSTPPTVDTVQANQASATQSQTDQGATTSTDGAQSGVHQADAAQGGAAVTVPSSHDQSGAGHRLPKLSLPRFDGDPLQYQSFWDAFSSAVHHHPSLSGIHKFNYLRAQLDGSALSCIAGLSATHQNYAKAVKLLQERFGQSHKVTSAHMHALMSLPKPRATAQDLRSFYDTVECHIRGLATLGKSEDTYGDLLVPVLLERIPSSTLEHLTRTHGSSEWTLLELRSALLREVEILEVKHPSVYTAMEIDPSPGTCAGVFMSGSHKGGHSRRKNPQHPECVFCSQRHASVDCSSVTGYDARIAVIKREKRCFNCLAKHRVAQCPSRGRCRKCSGKHHTSLCRNSSSPSPMASVSKPSTPLNPHAAQFSTTVSAASPASAAVSPLPDQQSPHQVLQASCSTSTVTRVLLKTAVSPVRSSSGDHEAQTNILFDEGAQRSFITRELADDLHLQPTNFENVSLSTFGGCSDGTYQCPVVSVHVVCEDDSVVPVRALVMPEIASFVHYHSFTVSNECMRNIRLAHPVMQTEWFAVSLLIGADHYWHFVGSDVIRLDSGPTAVSSRLGYLLSGPVNSPTESVMGTFATGVTRIAACNTTLQHQDELDLQRFWALEMLGIEPTVNAENSPATFLATYQADDVSFDGERYVARLPWRVDQPGLPTNDAIALQRTRATVKRLQKRPGLLTTYDNIIADQLERGFIELVPDDSTPTDHRVHYLPHHPVAKASATTPIRIVYDCSCRQGPGSVSLNDCLMTGPALIADLPSILTKFRLHEVGLVTDIEKAFLQIGLATDDRDATRFYWLKNVHDPDGPMVTYRFKVVLFGATCSPFILHATVLKHLLSTNTEVSRQLLESLYVDNVLFSVSSQTTAISFYHEARAIMSAGGFPLRSWASNEPTLQLLFDEEGVADPNTIVPVLGMQWHADDDTLHFVARVFAFDGEVTKRTALQLISRIYDPLGLLSPVMISSKIFMQDLWQQDVEWDEVLASDLQQRWRDIVSSINDSLAFTWPRQLIPSLPDDYQPTACLHVFVDASSRAYGAAAYLSHGSTAALVMAKSRVAPLKHRTIPELELMAAVIGIRLATHLSASFPGVRVVFWSDSQIVLCWIYAPKPPSKLFVANRVREVQSVSSSTQWHYCPTDSNPADLLTRGISAQQYQTSTLWRCGPAWLTTGGDWPTFVISQKESSAYLTLADSTTPDGSEKPGLPPEVADSAANLLDLARYSSLQAVLRVTAWVCRFATNCRLPVDKRRTTHLTTVELEQAQTTWFRACQQIGFRAELTALQQGSSTKRLPIIRQLDVFLHDGLLRCGGRLQRASVSYNAKHPVLLPARHRFTQLLILSVHNRLLHAGVNTTLSALRQFVWIPCGRQHVKTLLSRCVTCRRVTGRCYPQPVDAALPAYRITQSFPFSVTGVDFTGALSVKSTQGTRSAYVCLFTCAVSRAMHLELVPDLTAETFLRAFRRFISRRSTPRLMLSDNASTFQCAAVEIERLTLSPVVADQLSTAGTEWKFIPARAPWFGGFWERLIGLTKTTLKKVLGRALVSWDVLQTLLVETEAVLNDRPLTYMTDDIRDAEPLTPSMLLHGRRLVSMQHPLIDADVERDPTYQAPGSTSGSLSQAAQRHSLLLQQMWQRWSTEYVTALREHHRPSGTHTSRPARIGDIVIIHDDLPRLQWKLAVITKVLPGADNVVRAVEIRLSNGLITTRPITKLCPLELCQPSVPAPSAGHRVPPTPVPTAPSHADCPRRARRVAAMNADAVRQAMMDSDE